MNSMLPILLINKHMCCRQLKLMHSYTCVAAVLWWLLQPVACFKKGACASSAVAWFHFQEERFRWVPYVLKSDFTNS